MEWVRFSAYIELMSQKKISGYVIFLKEVLGKGSYGSVLTA